MIEWMLECGYLRRNEKLAPSTLPALGRSGHLDLAQQVVLLHSPLPEDCKHWKPHWVRALYEAGTCGNTSMLQWLLEHSLGREAFNHIWSLQSTSDFFAVAVKRGHLDALDYLYKQGFACGIYDAMRHAIEGGQTSIVKWLLSNHSFEDDSMSTRIDNCAEYGHLEILKLFHEVHPATAYEGNGAKRRRVYRADSWWSSARDPMYWAARGGHLDVLSGFKRISS